MLPGAARRENGPELASLMRETVQAAEAVLQDATRAVRSRVAPDDKTVDRLLDREQRATHALAWLATYVEAVRQLCAYAQRLQEAGRLGELERLIVEIGLGEYLAQMAGGIPMSQGEIARPADMGLSAAAVERRLAALGDFFTAGNDERRARLIELMASRHDATIGDCGLDETLAAIRDQMRKFADSEVVPHAQEWHRSNRYIPLEIIAQMSELGVFGLTIPEAYGGLGLGKESMCVVSEELARGYIGVGSLGTRNEIAAELILSGGTEAQKTEWLPKLASGEVLPTAVFTEPNTGSDLASLRTRAVRAGDRYKVSGNKTWITHPVRADLMTLLVRTNPQEAGHRGLSMLLAPKPRGSDQDPFPAAGMTGTEIEVLGYRGMKEYEIAFDGFEVPAANLLGGVEGLGFKQLMQTFESARIQTAARAIGVAQAAMEQALAYAQQRQQFGRPIISFPACRRQDRHDGERDHDRAPAHLFRRAPEGFRPALRSRGRNGQAPGRPRRMGGGRQCGADPRRQRICAGISGLAAALRRPHPLDLRRRRRDPGPGHRPQIAGRLELRLSVAPLSRP